MKTLLAMMLLGAALGGCSKSPQEPAVVQTTPAETAAAREVAEVAPVLDPATLDEMKRTLTAEGKACAQIVETHPREAENKLDVICIETEGRTQRVTHTLDMGAI